MSKKNSNNFKKFKERLKENESGSKYLDLKETDLKIKLEQNERFKPYIADYWVSNYGQVIHKDNSGAYKLLSLTKDEGGRIKTYYRVSVNGELMYVHRLVAEVWCKGHSEVCNEVHYKDKNGLNNYYKNLQWVCKPHHGFLNRDEILWFMSNREMSDFVEIDNLETVAKKNWH